MNNLENLNLVELRQDEMRQIEGGWWQIIVGALIIDSMINYDSVIDSFNKGFADASS